ncbi:MAG TPA: VanZ family protein [Nitrospira sp.]|jgi:VanZ family protein|nr:VanZ family protein [Nitrospira sp.]
MEKVFAETIQSRWMWYWLPVIAYASLIFYLSSLPHPEEELPKFLFDKLGDKLLHVIEYAVLALLCYRAFRWAAAPRVAQQAVLLAIVTASFYGMTDEVHQAFVPFRESSWLDWVADTAGAVIGAVGSGRMMQRGTADIS